ncbi:MAG: acyl-CoA dehydrogenase family protein [Sandaracinaceae bacterium]|nr:acyl-CoA dehydrogenase family protein [Sandaracinaceae bacterium]
MTPSDAVLERAFLDDDVIARGWDAAGALADDGAALERDAEPADALVAMVRLLGARGLLSLVAGGPSWRAVCLARERLGYTSPLLELAFTMQGLGSYPITLGGSDAQRARHLEGVVAGTHVAAFALTEPDAGSDLDGVSTSARRDGDGYVLDGHKVLISNAPVADLFTVFAATAPAGAPRRLSAFVVRRGAAGLTTTPTRVLGGHPIGEVRLDGVRVAEEDRLGAEGDGLRLALGTLHRFRTTVGAAAVGFAQRALDEAVHHTRTRHQFGAPLAALSAVQMSLADMACLTETARLLVYRAAALADRGDGGREAEARAGSMAKLVATENASQVIDRAVQLHGGRGVMTTSVVARLYEDVRALRIYEGASDVQRLLIARHLLADRAAR